MEAQELLSGLRWLRQHYRSAEIRVIGDSAIIVNMAITSYRVSAINLSGPIHLIREQLSQFRYVTLHAAPRAYNSAADGLCNWMMDMEASGFASVTRSADTTRWPLSAELSSDPIRIGYIASPSLPYQDFVVARWRRQWRFVIGDFERISHLVRSRFLGIGASVIQPFSPRPVPPSITTTARHQPSPFDTNVCRDCTVNGIIRCVPLGTLRYFQALATTNRIPFPVNRLFLKPADSGLLTIPDADVRLITALLRLPHMGIEGVLLIFRWQTSTDPRPNKALRPKLYRQHLSDYPDLQLLCNIAEHGVVPHWCSTSERAGVRPVPQNYPSAEKGATVVTHRLVTEYYRGRCILASSSALSEEPAFHSSAFALVPKKDIPLDQDGRIIHDLSAPPGDSINEATNTDWTPDARWDPYSSLADRVLELRRQYPDATIYALGADIAEAFLHVPVHSNHASAFGGTIPRSQTGIVSGTAVFGWTASPGYFAVFGKAARRYQRAGSSYVLGLPKPFWIFQWVDDIVCIEVDIGDRLLRAEQRLRDAIKLVFGSDGWHEGKFTTWSRQIHAVGIDWDLTDLTVSIPQRKIAKTKKIVAETLDLAFVAKKTMNKLVGVLRHVVTFIPIAKPFMQRLISVQQRIERAGSSGIPMNDTLRKDLVWWKHLVFENEFAGIPVAMFDQYPPESDGWVITQDASSIIVHGLTPQRTFRAAEAKSVDGTALAHALLNVVTTWIPVDPTQKHWRHIRIHVQTSWEAKLIQSMYCSDPTGQQHLRALALAQACRKLTLSVTRVLGRTTEARPCDVHFPTHRCDRMCVQTDSIRLEPQPDSSRELPSTNRLCGRTPRSSATGSTSVKNSDSQFGSTNCRKRDRHELSVSLPASAPSRDTTDRSGETSIKHSTAKWRQSPLHTEAFGMRDSITRIRNLSSLLRGIREPTATSTGSSPLPLPCCARCTKIFTNNEPKQTTERQTPCGDP